MHKRSDRVRYILSVTILAILAFVVWRNWASLEQSLAVLQTVPLSIFLVGASLMLVTFLCAATSYRMLAFRKLEFGELYIVELAAACINRLVPSGIGGLGAHGLYLHKRKHTIAQATAAISINNLISFVTHIGVLTVILAALGGSALFARQVPSYVPVIILGVLAAVVILLSRSAIRRKVADFARNLGVSLRTYTKEPYRLVVSALALLSLTAVNVLILWVMTNAIGISLGIAELFIIYSAGVLVGASVPTPGGLAGVEAGLVAGFLVYGVSVELAVATALAFRLVTYWFPLIPGSLALLWARKLI